jgi:hypothetical protein
MPTHQHQREKRNSNEREDITIRRHHGPSTVTRSFSWPIEQREVPVQDELRRLSPSPKRLPSSFAQSNERAQQTRENTRKFTVYRDPPTTDPGKLTAGADDRKGPPMRRVLAAKEVNQKLQKDGSCDATSKFLVQTEHLPNAAQQPKLEGLEVLRPPVRQMHRMSPLAEEPAPLTIRKRAVSLADAKTYPTSNTSEETHTIHIRQNSAPRSGEMESLIAVITAQLSGILVRPRRTFDHGSSIPEPLDLSTIRAEKMKRLSLSAESLSGHTLVPERGCLYEAETESLMSIRTALALDPEGFSAPGASEKVGRSRRWYKGFRRSA